MEDFLLYVPLGKPMPDNFDVNYIYIKYLLNSIFLNFEYAFLVMVVIIIIAMLFITFFQGCGSGSGFLKRMNTDPVLTIL